MISALIKKIAISCVTVAAIVVSPAALADLTTYNLDWVGINNTASATGYITLDATNLATVGGGAVDLSNVTDLSVTVQGTTGGNGVFGMSDFGSITFHAPGALNLGQQLIGQTLDGGKIFGATDSVSGDFNLFSTGGSNAPTGTWYFTLTAQSGEQMLLTSMMPVPEPESYAMLLAGLALAGAIARRKGKQA